MVSSSLTTLGTVSNLQATSPNFTGTSVFSAGNFNLDVYGNASFSGTLASTGALSAATPSFTGPMTSSGTSTFNGPVVSNVSLNAATPSFTGPMTSSGTSIFTNRLDVQQVRETVNDSAASANAFSCDYSTGALFYGTGSLSGNFTINITNVPTDNGKAMTVSLFVTQGATGRIPTTLNVNGSSVTILWVGGSAPTPTSSNGKIDIFNFTLIRRSSSWTALANANLNY